MKGYKIFRVAFSEGDNFTNKNGKCKDTEDTDIYETRDSLR